MSDSLLANNAKLMNAYVYLIIMKQAYYYFMTFVK